MKRLLAVAVLLLAFGTPGITGPLGVRSDDAAARLVSGIRPFVVRVEGLGPGGRRMPSAGVLLRHGRVALSWSRVAAKGWLAIVVCPGGERIRGEVTFRDPETGITVVRLEIPAEDGLAAGADELSPGSPVLAAGHAFGTERADGGAAVSLGVLAQVRRAGADGSPLRFVLSGTMNPGDYGGPLVDRSGRLCGILIPESDSASGLSVALPLSLLRKKLGDDPLVRAALTPPASRPEPGEWPVHDALREAAEKVAPSVASLLVTPAEGGRTPWSASGVLVDGEGHVVTTVANVTGAASITAIFPDGREYEARILGRDERVGIVLLLLAGEDFPEPARLAEDEPGVGRFVATVGNPNGRDQRHGPLVTMGLIGARNRWDRRYGALHTDAAVNRANAGGALVDLDGRVVGILSTLGGETLTGYGANSGIGFAIPATAVAARIPVLAEGETVEWRPGYLGVELDLDAEADGVRIRTIVPDQAAEKAGIQVGDAIVGANGQRIENLEDLRRIFSEFEVDEQVEIQLERDGAPITVTATLGRWRGAGPR